MPVSTCGDGNPRLGFLLLGFLTHGQEFHFVLQRDMEQFGCHPVYVTCGLFPDVFPLPVTPTGCLSPVLASQVVVTASHLAGGARSGECWHALSEKGGAVIEVVQPLPAPHAHCTKECCLMPMQYTILQDSARAVHLPANCTSEKEFVQPALQSHRI